MKNGNDKIELKKKVSGIIQVMYNDSGHAVELEQFEIHNQDSHVAKRRKKNDNSLEKKVPHNQRMEIFASELGKEETELLQKQACEVYEGQY